MTARSVFREEVLQNAQAAQFVGQTPALTGPVWSQWFVAAPASAMSGTNVLAFKIEWSCVLTATASANVTSGTSVIDENLDQLQVSADPTQEPRTYILDSYCAQELERIAFDLSSLSYPRATPANFSASGTRTDTCTLWVPAGGPVAAVRWHVPNITGVFASAVTATSQGTVRAVYGNANTVVVGYETTGSAFTGKVDIINQNLIPAGIAPDYVDFVGTYQPGNADGVTQCQAFAPDGSTLIDVDTAQTISDLQNIYPDQNATPPAYGTNKYATILALKQKRPRKMTATLGTSYTPTILWVQFVTPAPVAPTPSPSPTPVAPLVAETTATSATARIAAGLGVGPVRMQ